MIGKKAYQGKGYGTEAINVLKRFVFQTLNLNRLELDVYEINARAYQCYVKCGFKEEGRMRQRLYRDGRYWDVIKMAILREDDNIGKRGSCSSESHIAEERLHE